MKLMSDFNDTSLELLAASQIVITIWNRPDIVRRITEALNLMDSDEMLDGIDAQVLEILQSIERIPVLLLRDLECIITPIGEQIKAMRKYANFSPYFESSFWEFPVDLWTSYGTVDVKRLSRILVQDERRQMNFRYHLACINCFEDVIEDIYPFLTKMQTQRFLVPESERELVSYWTHLLMGDLSTFWQANYHITLEEYPRTFSAHQIAFCYAMMNGSKSGIEYFLDHLTPEESLYCMDSYVCCLLETIPLFYPLVRLQTLFIDAFYFLMSRLDETTRERLLRSNIRDFFTALMRFPFFGLVSNYATIYFSSLTMIQMKHVLSRIVTWIDFHGYEGFLGYNLLRDFWQCLNQDQKNEFCNQYRTHERLIQEIQKINV